MRTLNGEITMARVSTMSIRLVAMALAAAVGCGGDKSDPLTLADAVLLSNGVPVTDLSGAEDSRRLYKIVVPSGQELLSVTISGGTGDVDLFVRLAALPSLEHNDCQSRANDNNEVCEEPDPAPGDWYILIEGYFGYAGATLTATYSPPIP